jgi:uncharacterized membrane protein
MTAMGSPDAESRVFFDAILHPHRSLSPKGFAVLMGLFSAVSLSVGGFFWLHGAWPIFGFMGLDILLLYGAFRLSYRSARMYESVRLTERELVVQRVGWRGENRTWRFQPYWLRVSMDDPPEHESQITLSSHGRSLVIGAFLSPEERLDFAKALTEALGQCRKWQLHHGGIPA